MLFSEVHLLRRAVHFAENDQGFATYHDVEEPQRPSRA